MRRPERRPVDNAVLVTSGLNMASIHGTTQHDPCGPAHRLYAAQNVQPHTFRPGRSANSVPAIRKRLLHLNSSSVPLGTIWTLSSILMLEPTTAMPRASIDCQLMV